MQFGMFLSHIVDVDVVILLRDLVRVPPPRNSPLPETLPGTLRVVEGSVILIL